MRKSFILSAVGAAGAIGATAAGYYLKDKENREKLIEQAQNVREKVNRFTNGSDPTFEDAGVPDQSEGNDTAQLENSKMVSEGSQFGVQYYNKYKDDNKAELQQ
ncbi:hypothetical protein [Virgibacillus sp. YIM 98842]|uniref:hypothetical protein n=1 Tax=Virgibacillus sp. YIM 98842 TaxID=2663533 RepID=UPI0013DD110D|nr:hypothetical protein [Virgibacillus sp. YIM 98842]